MSYEQQHQAGSKPVIVIQPGPIHLFWTTGVYYYWLLKGAYDVILLVPESYRYNENFIKLTKTDFSTTIFYFSTHNNFVNHLRHRTEIPRILQSKTPKVILMHSEFYIENQYLIFYAKTFCPDANRLYYQNGRVSLIFAQDYAARCNAQARLLIKRVCLLERFPRFAGYLIQLRNNLSAFLNFKFFPVLLTGRFFRPRINLLTGVIEKQGIEKNASDVQDVHLTYLPVEEKTARALGKTNTRCIRHPLTQCATQVFERLYSSLPYPNGILILPSYGYIEQLLAIGYGLTDVISAISQRWSQAILQLCKAYSTSQVAIKLHPASKDDQIWQSIISNLKQEIPQLVIVPFGDSAEMHIIRSAVIVGDVSSSLWWAGILGNRIVISLDIFDYPDGDELKAYGDILYYLDDINKIVKFEPSQLNTSALFDLSGLINECELVRQASLLLR